MATPRDTYSVPGRALTDAAFVEGVARYFDVLDVLRLTGRTRSDNLQMGLIAPDKMFSVGDVFAVAGFNRIPLLIPLKHDVKFEKSIDALAADLVKAIDEARGSGNKPWAALPLQLDRPADQLPYLERITLRSHNGAESTLYVELTISQVSKGVYQVLTTAYDWDKDGSVIIASSLSDSFQEAIRNMLYTRYP